ncbi:hypothetical protein HXX76_010590 [Chlamydomonas incerta]|uniref:Uncharacterized protein n=1 Tax=Chlamydomonas incerta TaxID=51695 RepID=A0A835VYL0_CHLIN|nr:hypothetical protein HXX76_010590 [Chlamydomonas incerta]|eukprot:KAG2429806.1 hypothetical protein HXX76_010590 [Chlamydomonas incerta]
MVGAPKAWERHWEIIDRVGLPEFTPDPKLLTDVMFRAGVAAPPSPSQLLHSSKSPHSGTGAAMPGTAAGGMGRPASAGAFPVSNGGDPARQRRQAAGGPPPQPGVQSRKLRSGLVRQPLNRSAPPRPQQQQSAAEAAAAAAAAANLQYQLYLQQHAWMGGVEDAAEMEADAPAASAAAASGLASMGSRPHTAPSVPRLQLGVLHQPAVMGGPVEVGSAASGWESAAAAALADGSVASSQAHMAGLVGPSAAAWAAAEQSAAKSAAPAVAGNSAAAAEEELESEMLDSGSGAGVIRGLSFVPQRAVSFRKPPPDQQALGGGPGETTGGGSSAAQAVFPMSARAPGARLAGNSGPGPATGRLASAPSVGANAGAAGTGSTVGGALSLRLPSSRPPASGRGAPGCALQAQPSSGAALSAVFSVAAPPGFGGGMLTPAAVPLPAMPSVYVPPPNAIPPRERYRGILERVGRMAEHSRQERRRRRTGARAASAGAGAFRRRLPNASTSASAAAMGGEGDAEEGEESSPDGSPRGLGGWAGRWKAPLAQYTDSAVVQAGGAAAAAVPSPGSASARRRAADEEEAAEAARALGPEEHAVWQLARALDELGRFSCLDAVAGHTGGMTDGSVLAEVDARIAAMQRQDALAQSGWGAGGARQHGLLPPPPPAFPVAAARAYLAAAQGGVAGLEAMEEVVRTMRGKLQVLVGREGSDLRQAAADVLATMGAAPAPPQHPHSQSHSQHQSQYTSPSTSFKHVSAAVAAGLGGAPAGAPELLPRPASGTGARHASNGGAPPSRMSSNGGGGGGSGGGAPPGTAAARIRAGSSMRSLKVSFSRLAPDMAATALAEDDEDEAAPAAGAGGPAAGAAGGGRSSATALDPSANPYPSLTSPGNSDTAAYVESLLTLPGMPRGQAGLPLQGRTSMGGNTVFAGASFGGAGFGEGSASALHPMQSGFYPMSASGAGGAAAFASPAATSRGGGAAAAAGFATARGGNTAGGGLLTTSAGLDQAWALLESLMIQLHDSHAARAELVAGVETGQRPGSAAAGGAKTPRIGGTPAGGGMSAAAAMAAASASGAGAAGVGASAGAQFKGKSAVDRLVNLMDTTLQLGDGGVGDTAAGAAAGAGQGRAGGGGAGGRAETAQEVAAAAAAPHLARNAMRAAVAAALQPDHTEQVLYFITRLALMLQQDPRLPPDAGFLVAAGTDLLLGELAWLLALLRANSGAASPHLAALGAALRGYEGQRAHAATLAAAAERLELALEDAADRAAHAEHQLGSLQSLLQHAGSDVSDLTLYTKELERELEAAKARISLLEESLADAEGDLDRVEAVAEARAGASLGRAQAVAGELLAASLARVEARSVEVQVATEGDASDPRAIPPALAAGKDHYYPITPTGSMRGHAAGGGAAGGGSGSSVRRSSSSRPGGGAGADGGGRASLHTVPSKRGGKPGSPKRDRGSAATSRLAVATAGPSGLHRLDSVDGAGSELDAVSTPGASIAGDSEFGGAELIYTQVAHGGDSGQQQSGAPAPAPHTQQHGPRSPSGGGGPRPQSASHHSARQEAGSPPRRSRLGPRRSSGTGEEGPGPSATSPHGPAHRAAAGGTAATRTRRSSEGEQRGVAPHSPHSPRSPPHATRDRNPAAAASVSHKGYHPPEAAGGARTSSNPNSSSGEAGAGGAVADAGEDGAPPVSAFQKAGRVVFADILEW